MVRSFRERQPSPPGAFTTNGNPREHHVAARLHVTDYLTAFAPPDTAADWDNVGLLVGDPADPADRVMTCLTVTPGVVAEAVDERAGLIVSHHPVLFRGAKKLTANSPDGQLLLPLLRAGIAVYSPHTAFDNCPGGINDGLCDRLGLTDVRPLRPREVRTFHKLVVFTPDDDLAKVADAAFAAGAGTIGEYEQCSFRTAGPARSSATIRRTRPSAKKAAGKASTNGDSRSSSLRPG